MDILLVAATNAEIAPFTEHVNAIWRQQSEGIFTNGHHRLRILITGVGMVATTYALTKTLHEHRYDMMLQAGIAGSFNRAIQLAEVVFVEKEMFGDLGAEDHYNFSDVFELNLSDPNKFPFHDRQLIAPSHKMTGLIDLRKVSSLSINQVSGSSFTATARYQKYACDIESMEGAAFHYVCLQENIPFVQIRAISNYAEARNRDSWKMKEAISALNDWLIAFLRNTI